MMRIKEFLEFVVLELVVKNEIGKLLIRTFLQIRERQRRQKGSRIGTLTEMQSLLMVLVLSTWRKREGLPWQQLVSRQYEKIQALPSESRFSTLTTKKRRTTKKNTRLRETRRRRTNKKKSVKKIPKRKQMTIKNERVRKNK
jgi:hypothetical protein